MVNRIFGLSAQNDGDSARKVNVEPGFNMMKDNVKGQLTHCSNQN